MLLAGHELAIVEHQDADDRYGFGDPTSYSLVEQVGCPKTKVCRLARHVVGSHVT